MESALLISGSEKGIEFITQFLKEAGFIQITTTESGSEARRFFRQIQFDLIVINTPLKDEFGQELAISASDETTAGVILIVKNEIADDISAKVEEFGVFVLPKPINRIFFNQSIKLILSARKRLLGLKKENIRLMSKIEEIRLVDRAKCVLIQYLKLTEESAHHYIEKQAMDMRVTKREIAENILKTYE